MTIPTITPAPAYHQVATNPPPADRPVLIWWHVCERVAVWGGGGWHDEKGAPLAGPILYWREAPPPP